MSATDTTNEPADHAGGGPPGSFLRRRATAAAAVPLAVLVCLLAVRTGCNVAYPFALDPGEGTVLASAWEAAEGRPVYNAVGKPPWVVTVYNPLFIYLGAWAFDIAGPVPAAVRAVAVLFLAGTTVLIYLIVLRETRLPKAALVAALFFFASRPFYIRAGYAVTDYPGLFFSLAGLLLWRKGGRARIAALAAFALAFMSKQSFLAAPAAAFLSLVLEGKRRETILLFALFAAITGACVAACGLVFGQPYFTNALYYARVTPFHALRGLHRLALAAAFAPVILAGWAVLAWQARRTGSLILPAAYVLFGLLVGLAAGSVGSSIAYFFDLAAALSIVCGLLWARALAAFEGSWARTAAALAAFQLAVTAAGVLPVAPRRMPWSNVKPLGNKTARDLAEDRAVAGAFRTGTGIVFHRAAGYAIGTRAVEAANDAYKLKQLIGEGVLPADLFTQPIRNRAFSTIIVPKDEGPWHLFSEQLHEAIEEHYVLDHESANHLFYVPRMPATGGAPG